MTYQRILWSVILAALVVAIVPPNSSGHVKDKRGPFFYGRTVVEREREGDSSKDPINLIFMGGQHPVSEDCNTVTNETVDCVKHVLEDHGGIGTEFCNRGRQSAALRSPADIFIPVGMSLSISTSRICANQLHIRAFTDAAHGHATPQWAIGAAHRERVIGGIDCGFQIPVCRPEYIGPHDIYRSWEQAEDEAVDRASRTHCIFRNSLRLPGSGGRIRKFYSDGRVSRISMQHRDRSRPRGSQCIGG